MEDVMITGGGSEAAAAIVTVEFWLTLTFVESMTVIDTGKVPATAGVPLIVPPALIKRPLGSPAADHVYGATPPVAANVVEYAAPVVPPGRVAVEIASGVGAGGADDAPLKATISIP